MLRVIAVCTVAGQVPLLVLLRSDPQRLHLRRLRLGLQLRFLSLLSLVIAICRIMSGIGSSDELRFLLGLFV